MGERGWAGARCGPSGPGRGVDDLTGHVSCQTTGKTTRKPNFEEVSDLPLSYGSERRRRGKRAPAQLRISMVPPVPIVAERIEGGPAGSNFLNVGPPQDGLTRLDVQGEFTSRTLPADEVEGAAREFLDSEYRGDAAAIRALPARPKGGTEAFELRTRPRVGGKPCPSSRSRGLSRARSGSRRRRPRTGARRSRSGRMPRPHSTPCPG